MGLEVDLEGPVERAASLLSTRGMDFWDVSAAFSHSISVELLGRGVRGARSLTDLGLGVRAFKNKGLGVAFSQSLEPADVEATVEKAVSFARVAQPDPYFKAIPGPSKAPEVSGLYDDSVEALTVEDASRIARDMIGGVEGVRPGAMYEGGVSTGASRFYIATSTGVSFSSEKTMVSVFVMPTYRDGDDVGSSYEFDYSTSLNALKPGEVGRKAGMKAVAQFGSKRIESGAYPIILMPETSESLFFALLSAISGEQAVKGRTFASNLLGKQVTPATVGIEDDATIPGAAGSSTYDGEGVPRRRTDVLVDGVVKTFLHNSYSAGIAGVETTGHASRGGYGGYVGAGPTNVRVKPGTGSIEELITETRRGILVNHAGFWPNMVSGELSTTVDEGFLLENGERRHPVKNLMVGGQILELYKGIETLSREGRALGGGHFFPAVRISSTKVAGR